MKVGGVVRLDVRLMILSRRAWMKEESVLGTLLKTTDKLYPGTFSWDILGLHQATDYIQAFPWDSSQSAPGD